MKMLKIFTAAGLAMLVLAGCSTSGQTSKPGGFLTSYKGFRPGPKDGVDKIWVNPSWDGRAGIQAKLSEYHSVIIDPVWVSYKNADAYDGINTGHLQAMSVRFERSFKHAIGRYMRVAEKPGPGVLRISAGLTGVEYPNRILATTSSVLPVGLGISFAKKLATGEHSNVGKASMEIVVGDSVSGQTVFAAIDQRAGDKDLGTVVSPDEDILEAFDWWAGRLAATLHQARQ